MRLKFFYALIRQDGTEYHSCNPCKWLKWYTCGCYYFRYAYIMESIPLRYELTRNCSLMEIGNEINSIMYSIALPKSKYMYQLFYFVFCMEEIFELFFFGVKFFQIAVMPVSCECDHTTSFNYENVFILRRLIDRPSLKL